METTRILVPLPIGIDSSVALSRFGSLQTWPVGEASLLVATDAWLPHLARSLSRATGGFVLSLEARRRIGEEHVTLYFAGFCIERIMNGDPFDWFMGVAEQLMGSSDGLLTAPEGTPVRAERIDPTAEQLELAPPALARVAFTADVPISWQGWRHTTRPATAWSTAFSMAEREGVLDDAAIESLVEQFECTAAGVALAGDGPDFRWSWCDPRHRLEIGQGRGATAFLDIWEEFMAQVGERPDALAWPP